MAKTKNPDRELAVTGVRIMVPGQRARRHGSSTNSPTELELVGALMCGEGFPGVRKIDRIRIGLGLAVEIANRSDYARRRMIELLAVAYIVAAFDGEPTAKQWKRIEPMFWWAIRELKAGPLLVRIAVQAEGKFRAQLRVLLKRADLGTCTDADVTLAYS